MQTTKFNVSLNGRHLFRTDWYTAEESKQIAKELCKKFLDKDGFKVSRDIRPSGFTSEELCNREKGII